MRGAALLVLAACTDPAVDMTLAAPADSASFDLSCVTAVDLLPIPVGDAQSLDIGYRENNDMIRTPCVDLATPPHSFADVEAQIRGKFDLPLPPGGLAAVEIRGRAGTCRDLPAYHEAVFYGAASYDSGADTLRIPILHNISCDQATTYTVKPIDLVQLVKTKTCTPAASTTATIFTGDVRPSELGGLFSPLMFEAGPAFGMLASGAASLGTYKSSYAGTCLAAAWEDTNGFNSTCINPGMATACAGTDVELPMVMTSYVQGSLTDSTYAGAVIGAVWSNTGTPGPVANATIALDANTDAKVVFGNVGTTAFTPQAAATSTDASGMFVVYASSVVGITVSAPGHEPAHVFVGAGPEMPGAALVVLP